jgi:hypothetical protein
VVDSTMGSPFHPVRALTASFVDCLAFCGGRQLLSSARAWPTSRPEPTGTACPAGATSVESADFAPPGLAALFLVAT